MTSATSSPADVPTQDPFAASIWRAVVRLVDRGGTLEDLRLHRIHLFAARHWRSTGKTLPSELAAEEHASALHGLAAAYLLRQARDAYGGRILLMKGPEVAAHYPDPALRPFHDVDILVDDAEGAQRALLAAGFTLTGDARRYANIHHLQPLRWPGIPLVVEVHDRPKWLEWVEAPSKAELFEAAVPSLSSVPGVETLAPVHHALSIAVHSWAHVPLSRIGHLLDLAVLSESSARSELDRVAKAWGVERVWRTSVAAADTLFENRRAPLPAIIWARNLRAVRERNVLESHLERWLAPFWARPSLPAAHAALSALRSDVMPAPGESWQVKRARAAQALGSPLRRLSKHREELEQRSIAGPSFLDREEAEHRRQSEL